MHSGHRYRGANQILLTPGMHIRASALLFWANELDLSTSRISRLKRYQEGSLGKPRYASEELVAELGAVLLGVRWR